MTEYVTPMICSVLKKYQNSATKSLQGPALALIKKELLSSPEPHELHPSLHPHEAGGNNNHNSNNNSTTGATSINSERSQIYAAPLPPELSQPILSQPDSGCGELYETRLEGKTIGCFSLGGEMRLCLPQFLNNVLNDFTLEQINRIFDELGIYCSQCTPDQLVEFKAAKILPSDVKASGLITRTDAERLCAALLHRSDRNSYVPVESLAKGALSFQVYHKCFGKCEGICTPDMYSYQKPTCIKCLECEGWFSPQKFVGHVHRKFENRTCHWGFDSRNWHDYLHVALDVENREKYQRILDQLKEVELKEMHKAQCELDQRKRKAEMLMEDVLLGPLGLVAPQVPPTTHPTLPASLKHHQQHHHGRGVGVAVAVAPVPVPVELLDIPSKKHKALDNYHPHLDIQSYQLLYARCMQQQQQQQQQLELERERERGRERERERLVTQQLSSSAFQPWRSTKPPPAAILHAYALSSLPYACQEPPELQNPERVVSSKDLNRFERSYQPNVALAPRKSILSKERDKERELERQRLREQEQQREQREQLQLHIKQERASTPPAGLEQQHSGGSSNHSNHSSSSSNHSNHSNSSNSSSPMPMTMPKPAPAHLPAPPPPPPSHTTPTAAPPAARHVPRSPADEFSAGSNEITSSTSPVPTPTATATTTHNNINSSSNSNNNSNTHIIATVNQHAKLLPTSSNHHSNHNSNSNNSNTNNNHNEPSRIRINKNLMMSQPPASSASSTATAALNVALQPPLLPHQSGVFYKTPTTSASYSPTQSSSAGLNLSTHSSNVVSSPHAKQQQQHQQQQIPHQQQQLPMATPLLNGNGNGIVKPHLGSEFELSTDTDDDSLNGEPDSSAMLPPWELAVEALRDTRPKDRERVLHLLQRLLQENQQYRYNNVQLSELFHKQEAHIVELREQLQRCRRQLEALDKLQVVPLKQTTQTMLRQEDDEEMEEELEEEDEEEHEADSNETLTQDQANNNNNHSNHHNNNNNTQLKLLGNGLRRSPTPLKDEQETPATKRLKLQHKEQSEQDEQEEEEEEEENSSDSCKNKSVQHQQQNGHAKSPNPSAVSQSDDEEEEDEEEEEDQEQEEELDDERLEATAQAPHSSALATPPTATTPISPESAATAGQLFDSSNSSDASSMKKAQMSACQALAKITSSSNNNNSSSNSNSNCNSNNNSEEMDGEEDEEAEAENDDEDDDDEEEEREARNDDSDDDEMPLQQRQHQQQQQQQQQQQRRQQRNSTTTTVTAMPAAAATTTPTAAPILMATKASKKQTPPTPTPMITAAATTATNPTATATTTNCELQIKKEIV